MCRKWPLGHRRRSNADDRPMTTLSTRDRLQLTICGAAVGHSEKLSFEAPGGRTLPSPSPTLPSLELRHPLYCQLARKSTVRLRAHRLRRVDVDLYSTTWPRQVCRTATETVSCTDYSVYLLQ